MKFKYKGCILFAFSSEWSVWILKFYVEFWQGGDVGNVLWSWWGTDKPATNEDIWTDDNPFRISAPTFNFAMQRKVTKFFHFGELQFPNMGNSGVTIF